MPKPRTIHVREVTWAEEKAGMLGDKMKLIVHGEKVDVIIHMDEYAAVYVRESCHNMLLERLKELKRLVEEIGPKAE